MGHSDSSAGTAVSSQPAVERTITPALKSEIQGLVIESTVQVGLLIGIFYICYVILEPFIALVVWGVILAVAFQPVSRMLQKHFSEKYAAIVITLALLSAILIPTAMISVSSFTQGQHLLELFQEEGFNFPHPPAYIQEWPVIGGPLFEFWSSAVTNLSSMLSTYSGELTKAATWFAGTLGSGIGAVVKLILSIVIAGVFLATASTCTQGVDLISRRFLKDKGEIFTKLVTGTIRSVAQGVVGIAFIQGVLAGMGMFAVGLPGSAVWASLVMILAIMQLPPLIVLGPAIIYVFSTSSTLVAIIFTLWSLFAGGCDTFLKPLVLGRGVDVPMLVILLGSIGGMLLSGIIGLFVGAVMLGVGYKLFTEWLEYNESLSSE